MRGKKDTEITIHVWREGYERAAIRSPMVRDVVQVASVDGEMLSIPATAICAFAPSRSEPASELENGPRAMIHDESAAEGLRGMVVDLRDNPGGLLNQAVTVADRWLSRRAGGLHDGPRGQPEAGVSRPGRRTPSPTIRSSCWSTPAAPAPAEIVAGALQDHHRALVMGQPTFGKGSVQTVYPLEGGSGLRLTTALYYTPSGSHSIQEVGIDPDIEVHPASAVERARRAARARARSSRGHFTHDDADPETEEEDASACQRAARREGRRGRRAMPLRATRRRPRIVHARPRPRGAEELDVLRAPE